MIPIKGIQSVEVRGNQAYIAYVVDGEQKVVQIPYKNTGNDDHKKKMETLTQENVLLEARNFQLEETIKTLKMTLSESIISEYEEKIVLRTEKEHLEEIVKTLKFSLNDIEGTLHRLIVKYNLS
jgi:predicted RNase H-like nuclease (RuvC/YqgF family)